MNKSLFSIAAASLLVAGSVVATAETTTTTTSSWSNDMAPAFTQYSTTRHYSSINDPSLNPTVGTPLPQSVTVYPLPDTMHVPSADNYSYSIINNHPVVVERTTRRVVHTWE